MSSCTSPAGRLESHQRGFWIETLFQMQKTKALNWLFPGNVRRVEKQAHSYFGVVHAQEMPGGKPEIWLDLAHQISAAWPCHGWDFLRWLLADLPTSAGYIRDVGSIPGLGRSPEGRHGNALQYSCLESPMDRGAWWATVHEVAKSRTRLKWHSMHARRH